MNPFQIVIPTHARPHRQTTLSSLPPSIRSKVLIVTSTEADAETIRVVYSHPANRIRIADGVKSIAEKRHWIMENVKAKHIFMMDDDMYFFSRIPLKDRRWEDGWKPKQPLMKLLPKSTPEMVEDCFAQLEKLATEYAAVGLASRMGNDRERHEVKENARLMHAFGINRALYLKLKLDFREVPIREDMNVALHLLRNGHKNALLCSHMCSPGPYGAKGGASTERTLELSDAMAEKLAATHPGLVRVVEKAYKGQPRKEVVVSWKKAFAGGAK